MDIKNCKMKFEELFRQFFKEGYELSSYYSENLLQYLDNDPDKRAVKVIETPFFSDLIIQALRNIDKTSESVKVFIVEVLYVMLKNELQFSKIYDVDGIEEALRKLFMIDGNDQSQSPALALAGIKYCDACLSHSSGLETTVKHKIWAPLLKCNELSRQPKLDAAVNDLVCKIVWKLDEYNLEEVLVDMLSFIVDPIRRHVKEHLSTDNIVLVESEEEKIIYKPILTSLKVLGAILNCTENVTRKNTVVPLLANYLQIETPLILLLATKRDSDSAHLIGKIIFRLNFACIIMNGLQQEETEVSSKSIVSYCNITGSYMEKHLLQASMQFSVSCFAFWSKLDTKLIPPVFERNGRTFDVRTQFLLTLLIPLIKCTCSLTDNKPLQCHIEEGFFYKMNNLVTEHIIKNIYLMKSICEEYEDIKSAAIEAMKQLYALTKYLTEQQAGIVYQTLFYVLQSYVVTDENDALTVDESPAKCHNAIKLISLTLDLIKILLEKYEIKWYENVEIISLQNCLMNLLKQNVLPSKQILQALDLIDLSIKKFLSPDLALLVESRRGNTLNEIVAVIRTLIQHPEWELRDSALHILLTCTELAYIQYVPLQKMLQENDLIPLATHAALFDEETYVRAVALRVIAASTKIESLWNQALSTQPQLCVQLTHILRNNSDGSIRKEAAHILTEVYVQRKFSVEFTNRLLDVMTSTAIDDLHWEVQLKALSFWKHTIHNFLSQRGMIDGKFPQVTFCKQKRKIITLDEKTIRNHLVGIMNDLAATGCLKVLKECAHEECNTQVVKKAYAIAKHVLSLLEFYNFDLVPDNMILDDEPINPNNDRLHYLINSVDLKCDAESNQNEIIDMILATTQCDLIQDLYDKVQVKTDSMEDESVIFKVDKWMDPNDFIKDFKIKMTEYAGFNERRKSWNSGFKSLEELLDELLALGEVKKEYVEECD